ncbi:FliM/FliN family flagellar motor switch protein [Psychromonas sp. Urea-02u-13]|uniref:FliM/FliN family flagellar motor switch protein n=1 Tax=Psychromonas sp. Urea-02u-13 TaxID=2058326 RepID=UPI000C34AFC8|nr:FliM/FliN family flagellar motor C-terminal domain-containing protein [Psychromonas sp. Urea-02u-13]PKG39556.1 hypothetical protein CXF74_07780 [Psychromonas sp. Urea-02u-13]
MKNYQVIPMENLGLAQRRLVPRINQIAMEMQTRFNDIFTKMFNKQVETEIEAELLQSLSKEENYIYTSIDTPSIGVLSLSIAEESLIRLTGDYINEAPAPQSSIDNTAIRFFDKLAKIVVKEIAQLETIADCKIVVTKKLPLQAVILTFTLRSASTSIQFTTILNHDLVESLTLGFLLSNISKESIEASLLPVEVEPNVVLMQRELTLGELYSLNSGDVISMNFNKNIPFMIGDKELFTGQVSNEDGNLYFTVNDK